MTALTERVGVTAAAVPSGALAGTREIVRLILRRDRLLLPPWIVIMGALPAALVPATDQAYPTDADRAAFAATAAVNPAELAIRGPVFAPTTGGLTAWTIASSRVLICGLVSLLMVIRHTRVEEQAGRRELLGVTLLELSALAVALTGVGLAGLRRRDLDAG